MPSSVASDEDASSSPSPTHIDEIQAHGVFCSSFSRSDLSTVRIGINAADITKLKSNGYYTIAVSFRNPFFIPCIMPTVKLWHFKICQPSQQLTSLSITVRPRRNSQDLAQGQRFQRDQGRKDQGGHPEMPGLFRSSSWPFALRKVGPLTWGVVGSLRCMASLRRTSWDSSGEAWSRYRLGASSLMRFWAGWCRF
jgi:hypothetical protein